MASTTFDISDLRAEAQRGLHAGVGAVDLAIEAVRTALDDAQKLFEERIATAQKEAQQRFTTVQKTVQKSVKDFDFEPKALRDQATTVVAARVEELTKEARARREAVEKRVAELQAEAQKFVTENVETATGTYTELAKRGEVVVNRLRKETSSNVDPGNVSKTTGERVTATKTDTAKKTPAKKSTSRPATAKKAPAKKPAAKKAPAKKSTTGSSAS